MKRRAAILVGVIAMITVITSIGLTAMLKTFEKPIKPIKRTKYLLDEEITLPSETEETGIGVMEEEVMPTGEEVMPTGTEEAKEVTDEEVKALEEEIEQLKEPSKEFDIFEKPELELPEGRVKYRPGEL